jgi:predicted nucleic acid-binding protein
MRAFFYDTWAFAALANRKDPGHAIAAQVDRRLQQLGYAAVTSDYILDEVLTLLCAAAGGPVAVEFLDDFTTRVSGGDVQLVEVSGPRREHAFRLFRKLCLGERQFSFTDATSFAIMHELGIQEAFTADRHFRRAGKGVRPLIERLRGSYTAAALH